MDVSCTGRTTEGVVPVQSPDIPCSFTTERTTSAAFLKGESLAWSLVFTRSMGFVAAAAKAPLRHPAKIFRRRLLFSLSPPNAVFMGPYVPSRAPASARRPFCLCLALSNRCCVAARTSSGKLLQEINHTAVKQAPRERGNQAAVERKKAFMTQNTRGCCKLQLEQASYSQYDWKGDCKLTGAQAHCCWRTRPGAAALEEKLAPCVCNLTFNTSAKRSYVDVSPYCSV